MTIAMETKMMGTRLLAEFMRARTHTRVVACRLVLVLTCLCWYAITYMNGNGCVPRESFDGNGQICFQSLKPILLAQLSVRF